MGNQILNDSVVISVEKAVQVPTVLIYKILYTYLLTKSVDINFFKIMNNLICCTVKLLICINVVLIIKIFILIF